MLLLLLGLFLVVPVVVLVVAVVVVVPIIIVVVVAAAAPVLGLCLRGALHGKFRLQVRSCLVQAPGAAKVIVHRAELCDERRRNRVSLALVAIHASKSGFGERGAHLGHRRRGWDRLFPLEELEELQRGLPALVFCANVGLLVDEVLYELCVAPVAGYVEGRVAFDRVEVQVRALSDQPHRDVRVPPVARVVERRPSHLVRLVDGGVKVEEYLHALCVPVAGGKVERRGLFRGGAVEVGAVLAYQALQDFAVSVECRVVQRVQSVRVGGIGEIGVHFHQPRQLVNAAALQDLCQIFCFLHLSSVFRSFSLCVFYQMCE